MLRTACGLAMAGGRRRDCGRASSRGGASSRSRGGGNTRRRMIHPSFFANSISRQKHILSGSVLHVVIRRALRTSWTRDTLLVAHS